jgi:hypothetical protein
VSPTGVPESEGSMSGFPGHRALNPSPARWEPAVRAIGDSACRVQHRHLFLRGGGEELPVG